MRRLIDTTLVAFLAVALLFGPLSFFIGQAAAHQSTDHSEIGVDVTIESAVLLGDGHIRATGQYICGPEDEREFGNWGVGFRVFEGVDRLEGYAERSGPLTQAPCTGEWERWTLESTQVVRGGVRTAGEKIGKAKIQDALLSTDDRTHKHLGGGVVIPVTGGSQETWNLTASASKVRGNRFVDLEWNSKATTASSVDVYRDDLKIATTANDGVYTDSLEKGGGTATYHVCEGGGTVNCSQPATVSF